MKKIDPVTTEIIRNAFISETGYNIVSFDYSQIELRLAAEISRDENLIKAFKNKEERTRPSAIAPISVGVRFSSSASAPAPSRVICAMCETSNRPQLWRVAICSALMPEVYCNGMSQPAKATMRPPLST